MKKLIVLSLLVLTAVMSGCKNDELNEPTIGSGIFLEWDTNGQRDSRSMSFYFLHDSVWASYALVKVVASGDASAENRPVKLVQANAAEDEFAAIALPKDKSITDTKAYKFHEAWERGGTPALVEAATADGITAHYVAFDHPELMNWMGQYVDVQGDDRDYKTWIPANSGNSCKYPVLLLKDPSLSSLWSIDPAVDGVIPMNIVVNCADNEYFSANARNAMNEEHPDRYRKFVISFSGEPQAPSTWGEVSGGTVWHSFFGSWGPVKFTYIVNASGFDDWEMRVTDWTSLRDAISMWQQRVKLAIDTYNAAHPGAPLREPVVQVPEGVDPPKYSGKEVGSYNSVY